MDRTLLQLQYTVYRLCCTDILPWLAVYTALGCYGGVGLPVQGGPEQPVYHNIHSEV